MKKTLLMVGILLATSVSANQKELTLYKDLTHYKEEKMVNFDNPIHISLTDTAVLDTFNVSLKNKESLITPNSIEIHPKSEENIFKLNKNKTVFINGMKFTLMENGKGFIKVRNQENLITFIPKSKIEIISFENDVDSTSHIAQVIPNTKHGEVKMAYSYALGEVSWKPKYDLYLKDLDVVQLDYNIEINNQSLNSFNDVKVRFMLEDMTRYYTDYVSSINGGIFDYEQYMVVREVDGQFGYNTQYVRRTFSKEGFDQFGYDANGFDRDGFNKEGFNKVSSVLKNGKRAFEFSKLVNVPAKAKTLYPFKNAMEMSYVKENNLYINTYLKKDEILIPESTLKIDNKTGVPLSAGILRIFSDKKGFESIVLKETSLPKNKGNEKIVVNMGDNFGITAKIINNKIIGKAQYNISDMSKLLSKVVDVHTKHVGWKLHLHEITLEIENEGKEKNISIGNGNIISEKNKEWLLSTLKNIDNTYESFNDATEQHEKITSVYQDKKIIPLSKDPIQVKIYLLRSSTISR